MNYFNIIYFLEIQFYLLQFYLYVFALKSHVITFFFYRSFYFFSNTSDTYGSQILPEDLTELTAFKPK